MNRTHRPALYVAVGLAMTLAACSGSTATQSTTAPTTATTSAGVNPNAPEVNPAGDIPDNQVFIPYQAPSGVFTVKVPEGWAQSSDGNATVFTDKLNTIRIEQSTSDTAPTVQSVKDNVVPTIAAASANYESGDVTQVSRKSGPAILVTYRADSAPDSVTGKVIHLDVERYEFYSAGNLVTLTLSGPQGADNVDPWRIVTDSFTWTS